MPGQLLAKRRHTGFMRQVFAHEAAVIMESGADVQAPGAAITVALCGHWHHEPPCPLAPHHSQARRIGHEVRVRTLFVAEPDMESVVRRRIDQALAGGQLVDPAGVSTQWQLRSSDHSDVSAEEMDRAQRLAQS